MEYTVLTCVRMRAHTRTHTRRPALLISFTVAIPFYLSLSVPYHIAATRFGCTLTLSREIILYMKTISNKKI